MSEMYAPILVCDSRANHFDNYPQPNNFKIKYIIKRGGTIDGLQIKLVEFCTLFPQVRFQ